MRTDRGLYVHVPFCKRKCNYCDFASCAPSAEFRQRYIEHLKREILSYKSDYVTVDTVFFGGGTPSLLSTEELHIIMDAIDESFTVREDAEFTVEVNPATLTEDILDAFLSRGANRFSIGLQSIHENELKILGRIHSFEDFLSTYRMLRSRGISNISADLMFGIPEQTEDSLAEALNTVLNLEPEHISLYGLILEEGTPLFEARETLSLPNEDEERRMYFLAAEELTAHGYEHYEISNFAKSGYRCKHNLGYWRDEEYIGVGLAAHSYYNGVRYGNSRVAEQYFSSVGKEVTPISEEDRAFEYVMLALRLSEGFDLSEYKSIFGVDFAAGRIEKLDFYEKNGLLKKSGGRIRLTREGFYVSNTVISDLLA